MENPVGGGEKPKKPRMTDAELEEEQRHCEALIEKYGSPEGEVYSPGLTARCKENLRFVVEARNARAEARRLRADREGLLGAIDEYLKEFYPNGADRPADHDGARLEAAANAIRERSGACT